MARIHAAHESGWSGRALLNKVKDRSSTALGMCYPARECLSATVCFTKGLPPIPRFARLVHRAWSE